MLNLLKQSQEDKDFTVTQNLLANQDENINKLTESLKEEKFTKIFGKIEESNDTPLSLLARNFQEYDLNYKTNFQAILSILELQNEMMNKVLFDVKDLKNNMTTKVDYSEHLEFKKAVSSTLSEIMECISKTTQTKPTQSNKDEQSAKPTPVSVKYEPAGLTTNYNVSVAMAETNAKKENIILNEMSESLNRKKTIKNMSKPKETKESTTDVPMPVLKKNMYNETIDFDRLRNYQKRLPFLVMPEKLLEVLMPSKTIQDKPKQTKTNAQSVKHATKSIKYTQVSLNTNNVSETAKKPKTTKKYIGLNKFRNRSEMTQTNPKQTNTDEQSAKLTAISKKNASTCLTKNNFAGTSVEKNTKKENIILNEMSESLNRMKTIKNESKLKKTKEPNSDVSVPVVNKNMENETIDFDRLRKNQKSYKMTQTKHRQTNIDDKTAKPAIISIKNASPLLAANSVSLPSEKPKPMKENSEQLFEWLKKLQDSKIKRDHLVQNYTEIPIGKPATMLINHAPACLTTNNVSLPLEKLKPKEENIKYLLDELKKLINCETAEYKPTHMNTITPSAKLDTMLVKHVSASLTKINGSLPVEKLKNKKDNIDDILKQIIHLQNSIQHESIPSKTNKRGAKPAMMSIKHASASLTTHNTSIRKKRPKTMRGKIFRLR